MTWSTVVAGVIGLGSLIWLRSIMAGWVDVPGLTAGQLAERALAVEGEARLAALVAFAAWGVCLEIITGVASACAIGYLEYTIPRLSLYYREQRLLQEIADLESQVAVLDSRISPEPAAQVSGTLEAANV